MSTYAIGDVHGCLDALDKIMSVVGPKADDTVIFLGDYVNRGPDSMGAIDRVLELHRYTNVIAIRGNHDYMMSVSRTSKSNRRSWLSMGGEETLRSYNGGVIEGVPERHWKFLDDICRDWYETDTHIYVHATVDPDKPMHKQSTEAMHWLKLDAGAQPHTSGKIVVCGHTAQRNGEPLNLGHTVCIDTGCVFGLWLTCLDVDTGHYWQTKEEGWTREGLLGA